MIPKRIKLSGFLCYRDEQELGFDGSALWMLSGPNGSGKSTVFDAVTYALFSHHRGGSTRNAELINENSNSFLIEFDFELDGILYQIRRTLKRRATGGAATQQVSRRIGDGEFEPVPDTQRKTEFDAWIREHIGLNYDTFTSSVLLLQGRAEKLLDSGAKDRALVLASIVDLARYQRLHEKADSRRKELRGHVELLQGQFEAIAEVTEFELLASAGRIDEAEDGLKLAQEDADRLRALEFQAQQWAGLQKKLTEAKARQLAAGKLVQEAGVIEHDLDRLKELREVLPHVDTIFQRRADLSESQNRTKELADIIRDFEAQLNEAEHGFEQAKHKTTTHRNRIAEDDKKLQEIAKKLPDLSVQVERIERVDVERKALTELEAKLAKFPDDLPQRLADTERIVEEHTAVQQALPHLTRLHQHRDDLRQAQQRVAKAQKAEAEIKAKGESIKAKLETLKPQAEAAKTALKAVEEQSAKERTLFQQASQLLEEFDRLDGAKTCRACGQELTPKHYKEEKAERKKNRTVAEARVKSVATELKTAQNADKQLGEQIQNTEKEIHSARDEYKDAHNQSQQGLNEAERLTKDCRREYDEMAEPFRVQVAVSPKTDWAKTEFPASTNIEDFRRRVGGLSTARKDLEQIRDSITRRNSLESQIKAAQQSMANLTATVSGDPTTIRRDFARLKAENESLGKQLLAMRQEEHAAQAESDKFNETSTRLRETLADRNGKLQTEETTRRICEQAIAGAKKSLSPDWQSQADRVALTEMSRLRGEREGLETRGVEARAQELKQARIESESLKQTLLELETEIGRFPPEARRDTFEIAALFKQSRATLTERNEMLNSARNERANLDLRAKQRGNIGNQIVAADLEFNRFKLLAELLGRDRLQRHLVRQAERQIVDCANGVLDRLSSGQLMLRLAGSDETTSDDEALELECWNRATGESPFGVAFLSGSQRFRVAVSLALGIGQYASRQHRPIESVIIDEGFGSLDRNGRQVMIQELLNLRGQLRCIILVSHQEEFAEAFADGYRFELTDGTTRISRFQK